MSARALAGLLLAAATSAAWPQPAPEPSQSRGQLLYDTHCITCHTTAMHWREARQARDWDGIKTQVRRWKDTAGLNWSEDDVSDVARYLNTSIYHYGVPDQRVSQAR